MNTQPCHFCAADAVDRCFNCGFLFCGKHGKKTCVACQNSIIAGDPSPERVSTTRPKTSAAGAWWRPLPAEGYEPAGCYVCKGLTRAICTICGRRYCAEHAGQNFTCERCNPGTDWTTIFVGGTLAFIAILAAIGYLTSGSR